ncbi:TetR/AcrR family transcriptional regulator [Balneatrix alpica]|uniref:TetR/AcrR family transcriptional regulator n=1 Tax=Balneatrix alpica TaxID=75684 RepID=UPI00273A0C30|nr:TetR/AcrR family transcriptional regulator [Balneatrix alpica]
MSRIREKNEQIILQAASQVFADKGYAATKTLDVAKLSGLPKTNIYYYFKTKENLYRSVLESLVEPLLEASRPFEDNPEDPVKALSAYIRAKVRISRDYPFASKVFANEIMHGAPHMPEEVMTQLNQQTQQLAACIDNWVAQGRMAKVSAHHLLFTIWAATQTYADFEWQICAALGKPRLDEQDFDEATRLITRLVLRGCDLPVSA